MTLLATSRRPQNATKYVKRVQPAKSRIIWTHSLTQDHKLMTQNVYRDFKSSGAAFWWASCQAKRHRRLYLLPFATTSIGCRSFVVVHHKVSIFFSRTVQCTITKFYTDIHCNPTYIHMRYDVIWCFRSAVIANKNRQRFSSVFAGEGGRGNLLRMI